MARKGGEIVRKYTLANGSKRSTVDLRDYEDVIKSAVEELLRELRLLCAKTITLSTNSYRKARPSKLAERYANQTLNIIV